jgi:hypothetical protein
MCRDMASAMAFMRIMINKRMDIDMEVDRVTAVGIVVATPLMMGWVGWWRKESLGVGMGMGTAIETTSEAGETLISSLCIVYLTAHNNHRAKISSSIMAMKFTRYGQGTP